MSSERHFKISWGFFCLHSTSKMVDWGDLRDFSNKLYLFDKKKTNIYLYI